METEDRNKSAGSDRRLERGSNTAVGGARAGAGRAPAFVQVDRSEGQPEKRPTRHDVAAAVHEYIEVFYNRRRRHTTNGGKSPATYEALAEQQLSQAA